MFLWDGNGALLPSELSPLSEIAGARFPGSKVAFLKELRGGNFFGFGSHYLTDLFPFLRTFSMERKFWGNTKTKFKEEHDDKPEAVFLFAGGFIRSFGVRQRKNHAAGRSLEDG